MILHDFDVNYSGKLENSAIPSLYLFKFVFFIHTQNPSEFEVIIEFYLQSDFSRELYRL